VGVFCGRCGFECGCLEAKVDTMDRGWLHESIGLVGFFFDFMYLTIQFLHLQANQIEMDLYLTGYNPSLKSILELNCDIWNWEQIEHPLS
jgi:hypothetical protein